MTLNDLLEQLAEAVLYGNGETQVTGIACDSRVVREGDVFFAIGGVDADGREYVAKALESGAVAVVAEGAPDPAWGDIPALEVSNSRAALSAAAAYYYDFPSASLKVAGVTGTNGKTTTGFILHHLLNTALRRAGLIGTVVYDDGSGVEVSSQTTPGPDELQALLARMGGAGCRAAVMEVSSHGIVQKRVAGVSFDTVIFTNLSQDHLDYHGTMDAYFEAKRELFVQAASEGNGKSALLVVNGDDSHGRRLADEFAGENLVTFGLGVSCDFRATDLRSNLHGTEFKLYAKGREYLVRIPLIGAFNVYNALAALAASRSMGLNLREAVNSLATAPPVPGRLEALAERRPFRVFVDYAHTPDALENALETIRSLDPRRIITVFGCGGDRDKAKRRPMAEAVEKGSDVAIITSDNPRGEDPAQIIAEIEAGFRRGRYLSIENREDAIRTALEQARKGDVVLIAGKGHETYQEIDGVRHDFDDRRVARRLINSLETGRPEDDPDKKPRRHFDDDEEDDNRRSSWQDRDDGEGRSF